MEKVGHCVSLEPLTQSLPVFFLSASLHHEVKNPVSSPTAMVLRHLGPNDQDRSLRNHEPNKQTRNKQPFLSSNCSVRDFDHKSGGYKDYM